MKIGILGGSFNPIHNAHLKLASAARRQLGLKRVYFVLSPKSPFKLKHAQPSVATRWAMLKLALRNTSWARAADWELRRRGPSYTVTTLASYRKKHPADDIFFIVGSDSLQHFHQWKRPRRIAELSTIVVGRRPGSPIKQGHVNVLKGVFPAISSTEIRSRAMSGRSLAAVPKPVADFIRREKIYQ
jgi:nicotinate-nucleotide adenylyltransferase